jgi:hypothetical protein
MDRPAPAGHPTKDKFPQGPKHRVAGGRTSVSAPLSAPPQVTVPMGSEKSFGLNTPDIGSALACIRSFSTPWGKKVPAGEMRGQPARHECVVSLPDNPPAPFALTPTLSHSHPGLVSRESFGGRGGDARRCRGVSRRSDSPTDTRSVGSRAAAGRAWGRTSVSARWALLRRQSIRWTAGKPGSVRNPPTASSALRSQPSATPAPTDRARIGESNL